MSALRWLYTVNDYWSNTQDRIFIWITIVGYINKPETLHKRIIYTNANAI